MKKWRFTALSVFMLVSCSPLVVPSSETTNQIALQNQHNLKQHTIQFKLSAFESFRTQQSAVAPYVKLVISGKDSNSQNRTIYAQNSDANGFVATQGQSTTLQAVVPDGNNWVVTAGFYSNASDGGLILERKAAFHSANRQLSDPAVEIDIRTTLTGRIIEEIRGYSPSLLNTALNLNNLQAFVDGLVGAPDFDRLNELDNNDDPIPSSPKDPFDVDAHKLAIDISNGNISVSNLGQSLGESTNIRNYRKPAYAYANYALEDHTDGVRETMAVDTASGSIFMNDTRSSSATGGQTSDSGEVLYGVDFDGTSFTEKFKVSVDDILSLYLTTGLANNAEGSARQEVVYMVSKDGSLGAKLEARKQSDGSQVWSYNFEGEQVAQDSNGASFTPVVWRDVDPPGSTHQCGCDDQDILYVGFNASANDDKKGVYKIRSTGVKDGFYQYDGDANSKLWMNFASTGAISKDGSKLYVINRGSPLATPAAPAELIIINTADMTGTRISLGTRIVRPKVSPVLGINDATVYVPVYDANGTYLMAFNSDGSLKWDLTVDASSGSRPDYPVVVDKKSGQNQIYFHNTKSSGLYGKVFSVRDNNTSASMSWTRDLGKELRGSPILGENSFEKFVYVGTKMTGQVYGLAESTGTMLWQYAPNGSFASGFNFKSNYLLLTTKDGNDNDEVHLRAIKVDGFRLTQSAPWPKFGGNSANTGVSLLP